MSNSGLFAIAIKYRKREIELTEMLHKEASAEHYSQETRDYMLHDRDTNCLMERKNILQGLLQKFKRGCG